MNMYYLLSMMLQHQKEDFFFPSQASDNAAAADFIFYFIFYVSLFAFITIVWATVLFAWRYRRSKVGINPEDSPAHSTKIEIVWSVIPSLFMVAMFWYGLEDYTERRTPPADSYEIQAKGSKWQWEFQYPNGANSFGFIDAGEYQGKGLYVPIGKNVKIRIESADVLHSFSIPAFRVKMDAVPGRYTYLWFNAIELGTFPIFCTEYCGTKHSRMLSKVHVVSQEDFDTWLSENQDDPNATPEVKGEKLFNRNCLVCHSVDGAAKIGPPLNGKYGTTESLAGGGSALVDDNYIRESILNPNAKIVAGFEGVPMTSFVGQLSDDEISSLTAYLKSLTE
jgi:cytochrome c oxidase subunit 2